MAELQIVGKSWFAFETDLPPSSREIHPSGILHAFRSTPLINGIHCREEHMFAWIEDLVHVESALNHLQLNGFDVSDGTVFIPYSTKSNWMERYPHAAPALDCKDDGEIVVVLNWRPYPNGLGELGQTPVATRAKTAVPIDLTEGERENWKKNARPNILRDRRYIPDVDRDELHLEIYKYLSWFHGKLEELEKNATPKYRQRHVDMQELRDVLEKLESAFYIIPGAASDEAEQASETGVHKEAPFLEEALADKLTALVEARKVGGKTKRRDRRSPKKQVEPPKKKRKRHVGWNIFRSENNFPETTSASEAWKAITDEQREGYRQRARELMHMEQEKEGSGQRARSVGLPAGRRVVAVPPGKMGIGVRFTDKKGAEITSIHPVSPLWGKARIGDRIVAIHGCEVAEAEDLHTGSDSERLVVVATSSGELTQPEQEKAAIDESAGEGDEVVDDSAEGRNEVDDQPLSGPIIDRSAGRFHNILRKLEQYKEDQGDCLTAAELGALQSLGTKGLGGMYNLFEHPDKVNRRSPPDWQYQGVKIRPMYIQWHCGDGDRKMCPLKMWEKDDIQSLPIKRVRVSFIELRRLMALIDDSAAASGVAPTNYMTRAMANDCFDAGKGGLKMPLTTPSGRPRDLESSTWTSLTKYLWTTDKPAACAPKYQPIAEKTPVLGAKTTAADVEKQRSIFFRTVGVKQELSGTWRVTKSFWGNTINIGTYKTHDQAARINEIVRTKLMEKTYSRESGEEFRRDLAFARDAAENAVGCKRHTQEDWYNRGKR